jgi:hypothetical protein
LALLFSGDEMMNLNAELTLKSALRYPGQVWWG